MRLLELDDLREVEDRRLRRLRRHAKTRQVPVVAVSANAMPADIERGLAAGFARYLAKPLDLGTVLATIDDLLGR